MKHGKSNHDNYGNIALWPAGWAGGVDGVGWWLGGWVRVWAHDAHARPPTELILHAPSTCSIAAFRISFRADLPRPGGSFLGQRDLPRAEGHFPGLESKSRYPEHHGHQLGRKYIPRQEESFLGRRRWLEVSFVGLRNLPWPEGTFLGRKMTA